MPAKDITVNTNITLRDTQFEALGKLTPAKNAFEALPGLVSWSLGQLADGAVFVPPPVVARIRELIGPGKSPEDLIPYLEKAVGKRGDNWVVEWEIDPYYQDYFQTKAMEQGVTVQEFAKEILAFILDKGWVYAVEPQPARVLFKPGELDELRSLLGKSEVSGQDILSALRPKSVSKKEVNAPTRVAVQ